MKRFILLIFVLVFVLSGCKSSETVTSNEISNDAFRQTVLYYKTDAGYIVPVSKSIVWQDGIGKAALQCLVEDSKNRYEYESKGLKPTIPEGTELELSIKNGDALVNIKNLPKLENADAERALLQSVVNTLTEFESIESVSVRFDGKKLEKMPKGTVINDNMSSFMLNPIENDIETGTGTRPVKLFVPDNSCSYIVPMTAYLNEPNLEMALQEFCNVCNSMNNGLPYGTEVIAATVTNGVGVIKFNSNFSAIANNDIETRQKIVKALYLTAMEFDDIKELKLYAEQESVQCGSFSQSELLYVNMWS